jgi:hypothetical protein
MKSRVAGDTISHDILRQILIFWYSKEEEEEEEEE